MFSRVYNIGEGKLNNTKLKAGMETGAWHRE